MLTYNFERIGYRPLLTAIASKHVDNGDICHGRKNDHLTINGKPAPEYIPT